MKKVILIVLVLLALAAGVWWYISRTCCAPPDETSQTPAPGSEDVPETVVSEGVIEVTIEGDEYSFSPATITVKDGITVRLTLKNNGNVSHNFLIDALDVDSGLVSPGSSKTFEFTAVGAGTYSFYCSVPGHEDSGMVGTLKVE
jgi:uncharacterized cupredoxin-like copper-binding protein